MAMPLSLSVSRQLLSHSELPEFILRTKSILFRNLSKNDCLIKSTIPLSSFTECTRKQ